MLQVFLPATICNTRTLWPSEMNLYNDTVSIESLLPENATASNSKKGFLLSGDPREVFTLGAGHIAINVNLSGKGHIFIQYLEALKKRGVQITLILVNDKAPVGLDTRNAPKDYQNPYFYLMDFSASNGDWQRYNFERIVEDYSKYVDNWVLGNEINSQLYGYYGPASVEEYTKKFCETFEVAYNMIKESNENANVYFSFDQGWDLPELDSKNKKFNKILSQYRYNAKEQLFYINKYLDKKIDWGVSIHPYPAPVESAKFWDDVGAGYDINSTDIRERPYLLTLKNLEIIVPFLADKRYLKRDGNVRNIIITEFALTSHDGERIQAAGLYYLWEKIKDNPFIKAFLYNSQTDLPDGYHFGLTSDKNKKRLIWAVFKDMDRENENGWCKDLLDSVLEEQGYFSAKGVLFKTASVSEADRAILLQQ